MLSSPRKPSRTIRIFSSAENCRRVCRRVSILEEYRVTCAQCVKGDPVIEPFHSSTVEDTQRLQSHSSVY